MCHPNDAGCGICHSAQAIISVYVLSPVRLFVTSMNCSPPGSSVHEEFPGKNTAVGYHLLLQGIFLTQGPNSSLLHCRQILYTEPAGKPNEIMGYI